MIINMHCVIRGVVEMCMPIWIYGFVIINVHCMIKKGV